MLRLRLHSSFAAIALCLAGPVQAQAPGGLGGQLDAAEQKLTQDSQSCAPINLGDYQTLLNEAAKNKRRAEKAKKAGVPVDDALVDADLAKASALFNRAVAAHVQQCVRQATGQGQTLVQPQTTPAQSPTTPQTTPATTPAGGTSCAPQPTPAAADDGPTIPTQREIQRLSEKMFTAAEEASVTEADFYLRVLDGTAARLSKIIRDAKAVGEFGTVDVKEAEQRLKEIEELRKAGEQFRLPCPPPPPFKDLRSPTQLSPLEKQILRVPNAPPANQSMNLSPFAREVLAVHNTTRAEYGAPPLKWDPELAGRAGAWAGELAGIGRLEHSPREGRGTARENIAQAPLTYSAAQIVGRWIREKADFVPGTFPNVCRSGGICEGILHVSQMIWPTTTALGCGLEVGRGSQWLVCYYNPGGNKDGKPVGMSL